MTQIAEEGLRFVFAGPSIVSDWGNPAATTNRAVMTALIELGHEATFLEPRMDVALLGLLKAHGSAPMRSFLAAYPKLQYRTVDVPAAYQASSWAGQYLSTASAAVVLLGCPSVIADGFRQFEDAGVRYLYEDADGPGSVLKGGSPGRKGTHYQAAVLPKSWDAPRLGTMLVAYDDAELARSVAKAAQPDTKVVSGRADLPDWEWVPEVDLPERYGRAERVLVVDGRNAVAPARVCLPRANGATAWGVVDEATDDELSRWSVTVAGFREIDWTVETPISADENARTVADRLATTVGRRDVASTNGAQ